MSFQLSGGLSQEGCSKLQASLGYLKSFRLAWTICSSKQRSKHIKLEKGRDFHSMILLKCPEPCGPQRMLLKQLNQLTSLFLYLHLNFKIQLCLLFYAWFVFILNPSLQKRGNLPVVWTNGLLIPGSCFPILRLLRVFVSHLHTPKKELNCLPDLSFSGLRVN